MHAPLYRRAWVLLLGMLLASCSGGGGGSNEPSPPASSFDLGVAYSPRGFENSDTAQDVIDFYQGHAAYGEIIASI